jgi:hypothetical protein
MQRIKVMQRSPPPAAGVLAQRHLLQCGKQNISNCRKWKEDKQMLFIR